MKKRILLVDDDASVRASLAKALRGAGYDVSLAKDESQAVERFAETPIDLLVLDIGLPHGNGWEAFERITSMNPTVPVIMITGQSGQVKTARAAGVGALMEKPLDPVRLLQTMQDLLNEPKEARLSRMVGYSHDIRHLPPVPQHAHH